MRAVHVASGIVMVVVVGCAGSHGREDAGVDARIAIDVAVVPSDGPRSCELHPSGVDGVQLVLEPHPGNPASCTAPVPCEVWFGHGQHLRCPRYLGPASPVEVECDIWDCICDDESGFVADFSTGEATDARVELCRYRIVLE